MWESISAYSKPITYGILAIIAFLIFVDMDSFSYDYDIEADGSIVWGILENMVGRGDQLLPYSMLLVAYIFLAWKYEPKIEKWLFSRSS